MTLVPNRDGTRQRLRCDADRLRQLSTPAPHRLGLLLHASFLCVLLYRLSHHCQRNGWPRLARLWWRLNIVLTGADISPTSDLGPGLFIQNPTGVAISGHAGRNLSVMAGSGLSRDPGRREDVGAGPGRPVLGDDVWIEPHGGVFGPVRVGNRVRIGAGVPVTQDVSDDCELQSPRPRVVVRPAAA
jgi:serine O-acetyltransferase